MASAKSAPKTIIKPLDDRIVVTRTEPEVKTSGGPRPDSHQKFLFERRMRPVIFPTGIHPFPFRTRQLSLSGPMVVTAIPPSQE